MKNLMMATALAVVSGLGLAAVAHGAEATASVNVRSGPGTAYTIVDTLYPGEQVGIAECRSSGWCLVAHSGPDGWVSSRYLTNTNDDEEDDFRSSPTVHLSFSFGRGRDFSMGGGPRGSNRDLVCLVTFQNAGQVAGGADADVVRAQVMPRFQAEQMDRPNDRRGIFDYGTNQQTRDTCEYLDNLT
jgi:uncharacterized protein YgiM (DUF1202 family)